MAPRNVHASGGGVQPEPGPQTSPQPSPAPQVRPSHSGVHLQPEPGPQTPPQPSPAPQGTPSQERAQASASGSGASTSESPPSGTDSSASAPLSGSGSGVSPQATTASPRTRLAAQSPARRQVAIVSFVAGVTRLGTVYFVSGQGDPDGRAYFSWASAGAGLAERLAGNLREHSAGSGRRAFPDLYVDATGSVHLVYGARHQIYYNRYGASGEPQLASDVLVFDGLGDWHLSTGLGAVAAADDGQTVLAVGLRSDGSAQASSSALLWSYSSDGGQTWSPPEDSGRLSHAGEGRRLPRIVALGQTFFVFFYDNASAALSLATVAAAPGS